MTNLQKEVLNLINENYAISEIAKKLNRNISSISSVVKRFNIQDYKKLNENKCNHNYFDEIDNEFKSYLLGFFIADGYLHSKSNRFGINIANKDRIVLEYLNKNVCPNNKIYVKNRTTQTIVRVNQCSLRWSSEHMKSIFINKYKILDNKTYDNNFVFPIETIPENLIRHFIRGFIDGDGSISKDYKNVRLMLISTSKNFLLQLSDKICSVTEGLNYTLTEKQGKTINYYTLDITVNRINKSDKFLEIYKYLYKDSELYLSRKKNNLESYLKYRGKL